MGDLLDAAVQFLVFILKSIVWFFQASGPEREAALYALLNLGLYFAFGWFLIRWLWKKGNAIGRRP